MEDVWKTGMMFELSSSHMSIAAALKQAKEFVDPDALKHKVEWAGAVWMILSAEGTKFLERVGWPVADPAEWEVLDWGITLCWRGPKSAFTTELGRSIAVAKVLYHKPTAVHDRLPEVWNLDIKPAPAGVAYQLCWPTEWKMAAQAVDQIAESPEFKEHVKNMHKLMVEVATKNPLEFVDIDAVKEKLTGSPKFGKMMQAFWQALTGKQVTCIAEVKALPKDTIVWVGAAIPAYLSLSVHQKALAIGLVDKQFGHDVSQALVEGAVKWSAKTAKPYKPTTELEAAQAAENAKHELEIKQAYLDQWGSTVDLKDLADKVLYPGKVIVPTKPKFKLLTVQELLALPNEPDELPNPKKPKVLNTKGKFLTPSEKVAQQFKVTAGILSWEGLMAMAEEQGVVVMDNSGAAAHVRCKTESLLRYALGYRARSESAPLAAGSAAHEALEIYLKGGATPESQKKAMMKFAKLYAGWADEHEEDVGERLKYENLEKVMRQWFEQHRADELPFHLHNAQFELSIALPVAPDVLFMGRLDGIVQAKNDGSWYALEHKTTGFVNQFWTSQWTMSSQLTGYIWAARQMLGKPVVGAFINAIEFGKLPGSDRKCTSHGMKYIECSEMHAKWEMIPVTRQGWQLDKWQEDFVGIARDFVVKKDLYPTIEFVQQMPMDGTFVGNCRFCQFKDFCGQGRPKHAVNLMLEHDPWDFSHAAQAMVKGTK